MFLVYYTPGMGGTPGVGGTGGADGVEGTGGTGAAGANKAWSSGTCPAGSHAGMPCCQTKVSFVSCPVGTNDFNVL